MNFHCPLEEHPVGNVEPVKFIMQYLTQAAVKLPCAGDDVRSAHVVTCPSLSLVQILQFFSIFKMAAISYLGCMHSAR